MSTDADRAVSAARLGVDPSVSAAGLGFDPSDLAFLRNPYPVYDRMRDSAVIPEAEGSWFLTRHADVLSALRDPKLSSNPAHRREDERMGSLRSIPFLADGTLALMLLADPPDHTRLRRLANRAFTPRAVEGLRPRVAELVDGLLDRVEESGGEAGGEADLMAGLAEPLPVMVICDLLGVPAQDWDQFKPWSTAIARVLDRDAGPDAMDQALPAVVGFVQYFAALVEERRDRPTDDLLSRLIAAEEEGESLSRPELFAMIILLFIAGHETTTNLIGNGSLALLRHPDQMAAWRQDPSLAVPAVEELLRYDAPVQVTARTAMATTEISGLVLQPGDSVVCGLAAANRDPDYMDDPGALILRRGVPGHVSFGHGMHHCLGAPLARLEGQEALGRLVARFPDLVLAQDDPAYRAHFVLRGLASLPVSLVG
ncbi:MAG TPA: cytochrome P450 [Acidimicrobiales bacterium]|nr:cytochrome P450 [Acidimicrobiales bacterium]